MTHITSIVIILSYILGSIMVSILSVLPNVAATSASSNSAITNHMANEAEIKHTKPIVNEVDFTVANAPLAPVALSKKLNVVTSVSPITNIVKNIGGDQIHLIGIIREGVNSHTFELVPSDIVKVLNADLVIMNGLGLETNLEYVAEEVSRKNAQLQILKLGDNTIGNDQWIFDFSYPKESGGPNPHLWLNVAHAMKFANLAREKLTEMDPQNAHYYSDNTSRYISLLRELDEGISQAVQTVPPQNRKLFTYHDSWSYFAARYGMTIVGAVQPSEFGEPTPQEVASVIDQIRFEKVPAIFGSDVFPSGVMNQIAKEGNVKAVETLSDDDLPGRPGEPEHTYVGMMLENIESMVMPLGGNITILNEIDPRDTYLKS
jgi:ABC-type Zn uptake system ZnuABC Zn-binding protein ZnuA